MKLIEAKNISYKINDRNILNNISFVIDLGELVKISGDNGSGKTTLLKIIIGLTKQTKGELINHNEDKVCFLGHKNNLKNYISYYRLLTDAVNIKDAFIVNIGIDFEIRVLPNYNSNEVLLRCVQALKDYFNIDSWRINEPIYLSQMYSLLDSIKGVQSAVRPDKNNKGGLEVYNKFNGNYSPKMQLETVSYIHQKTRLYLKLNSQIRILGEW